MDEPDFSSLLPPNASYPGNFSEGDGDFNSSERSDPSEIYWQNPEEMLNPAKRNPIFYQIIVTHAVTFFVGKEEEEGRTYPVLLSLTFSSVRIAGIVGNLIAVFVMVGDRKSRNATNLFLVR